MQLNNKISNLATKASSTGPLSSWSKWISSYVNKSMREYFIEYRIIHVEK